MTIIQTILELLNRSRVGMTIKEIYNTMPAYEGSEHDIAAIISNNCNNNYTHPRIRTDGKRECPTCHHNHTVYRITDEGRMYLADRSGSAFPVITSQI